MIRRLTHQILHATVCSCVALAAGCTYASVGSGEVAVVRTPTGVDPHVYPTGDWKIGGDDRATLYSVRSQERAERLEVLASDGLGIVLDASIRFHVIGDEAIALDRELGPDYYGVLIGPTLKSQARRVVGRFKPEEIYSSQREQIEKQIREGVETAIKGRHIALEAVLIRNVALPAQIQQAINDKLEAEQAALKMKFVLDKQGSEDQQKLMESKAAAERAAIDAKSTTDAERVHAEGAAQVARIEAEAAADAKRLDGQATSDYERLIKENLTAAVLKLQEIQATKDLAASPNAKVVWVGQGAQGAAAGARLDLRDNK